MNHRLKLHGLRDVTFCKTFYFEMIFKHSSCFSVFLPTPPLLYIIYLISLLFLVGWFHRSHSQLLPQHPTLPPRASGGGIHNGVLGRPAASMASRRISQPETAGETHGTKEQRAGESLEWSLREKLKCVTLEINYLNKPNLQTKMWTHTEAMRL